MSLPRGRPATVTDIRSGRRPIGATKSTETKTTKPASAPKPAPEPPSTTRRRPVGTSRIAVDVPGAAAQTFRARAQARRWTQSEAPAGGLHLLEQLSDAEYDALLTRLRG